MGELASVVALRGCFIMPYPMRGPSKKVGARGGCKGEDVGLENGTGAWRRVREGSVQDVIDYKGKAVISKYNGGWLRGWSEEKPLPFIGGGGDFSCVRLRQVVSEGEVEVRHLRVDG